LLSKEIPVETISSNEYPSPTKRPSWSVMDKSLIQRTFQVDVPDWSHSLQQYLQKEKELRG
jgi:dTDP-4-dehydrorhamnose reductase